MPLPKGYTLDAPQTTTPTLPAGYTLDAPAQSNSIPGLDGSLPSVPSATPSRDQLASQMKYVTSPSEITGGAWDGIKSLVNPKTYAGMATQINQTLPKYANVGGIPLPVPNSDQMQSGADQIQAIKDRPARVASSYVAPALLTAGLGRVAARPLEVIGGKMQDTSAGMINKAVGSLQKDFRHGADPGRAYLDAGLGPSTSMESIADKAAAKRSQVGAQLGSIYKEADKSGLRFPVDQVQDRLAEPIDELRSLQEGPGGTGASPVLDQYQSRLQPPPNPGAVGSNGYTPTGVFSLKRAISGNTKWNDPTQFDLNAVRQENVGSLGGMLTDAIPSAKSLNSQYQGLTNLTNRASLRAQTGSQPLTGLFKRAGEAAAGAAVGSTHGPLGTIGGAVGGAVVGSIPFKTTIASGLYGAGRGAVAIGSRLQNLYGLSRP